MYNGSSTSISSRKPSARPVDGHINGACTVQCTDGQHEGGTSPYAHFITVLGLAYPKLHFLEAY